MTSIKYKVLLGTSLAAFNLFAHTTSSIAVVQTLNGQTGNTQTFANDTNITISSASNTHSLGWNGVLSVLRGGTGASSFSNGSLLFYNGSTFAQDNSNLFWDNTNKRLGIGTSSPTAKLDVSSDIKINGLNLGLGGSSISSNTSVGVSALLNATSNSYSNTAIGANALYNAGDVNRLTAVGYNALSNMQSGADSTAVGYYSLSSNTGGGNTAVGSQSLISNTDAQYNTALGGDSMHNNQTGGNNTALGFQALYNNNGSNNIAIGANAGLYQASGFNTLTAAQQSIYIGKGVRGYDNNDSNSIVLGYDTIGAGANTTVIGNTSMGNIYFGSSNANANTHALTLYSGSSSVPGCIVMGDTNGGIGYITLVSGVVTVSSTKPSACQ